MFQLIKGAANSTYILYVLHCSSSCDNVDYQSQIKKTFLSVKNMYGLYATPQQRSIDQCKQYRV